MKVVVIGQGAREHAIAWSIAREHEVTVCPGNDLIARDAYVSDELPESLGADLYVIGPEVPLVDGLADDLRKQGFAVLGPGADGALLEGSKAFLKEFLAAISVPTADFAIVDNIRAAESALKKFGPPYVIKTDGLAAGKGVLVTTELDAALADADAKLSGEAFGDSGKTIVIESGLEGREVSVFALLNGTSFAWLPSAKDYKRVGDGNLGPNTGGMGSISPAPLDEETLYSIEELILKPTVAGLNARGIDYRGVLYLGLMITRSGPMVIEYNVRLGDPEAEAIMPRLRGDVGELFYAAATGSALPPVSVGAANAVTVVMASRGYPGHFRTGDPIEGLEAVDRMEGTKVFGAGVRMGASGLETNGGRVLAVTGTGGSLEEARARAYSGVAKLHFEGASYRHDIGSE
jgi:phosphoribosylamine--glycine ligase